MSPQASLFASRGTCRSNLSACARATNQVSNNRHRKRWTPADTDAVHRRDVPTRDRHAPAREGLIGLGAHSGGSDSLAGQGNRRRP
jgi:hypothetical protein